MDRGTGQIDFFFQYSYFFVIPKWQKSQHKVKFTIKCQFLQYIYKTDG